MYIKQSPFSQCECSEPKKWSFVCDIWQDALKTIWSGEAKLNDQMKHHARIHRRQKNLHIMDEYHVDLP